MGENTATAKELCELGKKWSQGEGVPVDKYRAEQYFLEAAQRGSSEALFLLGYLYSSGERYDLSKSRECWFKAAEQGYAVAQVHLGFGYESGREYISGGKDEKKALYWYTKAAEQGDAGGLLNLGQCYQSGKCGLPKDVEKANRLYAKAAGQGDDPNGWSADAARAAGVGKNPDEACERSAMYALGINYYHGNGVPKDVEKAKKWIALVVENGYYTKTGYFTEETAKKALERLNAGKPPEESSGGGCYVATCIYGSYDCPQVRTLRRYRDSRLSKSWLGRRFVQVYYTVSPTVVALFGGRKWFNGLCKPIIDAIVRKLQNSGVGSGTYSDM